MEVEITIRIATVAKSTKGNGFAPETIVGPAVFITIWIGTGKDNPVDVFNEVTIRGIFNQLVDEVQSCSRSYPFSSMNTSIHEDYWFRWVTATCRDANDYHVAFLVRLANVFQGDYARVLLDEFSQIVINLRKKYENSDKINVT